MLTRPTVNLRLFCSIDGRSTAPLSGLALRGEIPWLSTYGASPKTLIFAYTALCFRCGCLVDDPPARPRLGLMLYVPAPARASPSSTSRSDLG